MLGKYISELRKALGYFREERIYVAVGSDGRIYTFPDTDIGYDGVMLRGKAHGLGHKAREAAENRGGKHRWTDRSGKTNGGRKHGKKKKVEDNRSFLFMSKEISYKSQFLLDHIFRRFLQLNKYWNPQIA